MTKEYIFPMYVGLSQTAIEDALNELDINLSEKGHLIVIHCGRRSAFEAARLAKWTRDTFSNIAVNVEVDPEDDTDNWQIKDVETGSIAYMWDK